MAEANVLGNVENTSRSNWIITWKDKNLGLVDDVDPTKLKHLMEEISVGSLGKKLKLGDRFIAMLGELKVQIREVVPEVVTLLQPWLEAGEFKPAFNTDWYKYADLLVLHPTDRPADD